MWLHNAINLVAVSAYNEEDVVRATGGLTQKTDTATIVLKILIVPTKNRFKQGNTGRFEEKMIQFQVSKSELNKKSFTVTVGKTHIIRNGEDYKVMQVQDGSLDPGLQLYDCLAKRMIPVNNLI